MARRSAGTGGTGRGQLIPSLVILEGDREWVFAGQPDGLDCLALDRFHSDGQAIAGIDLLADGRDPPQQGVDQPPNGIEVLPLQVELEDVIDVIQTR